jgi:DNA polymerase III subunit epsilon
MAAATFSPPKALAFVDVQTSGLDPAQHDILELAVLRVDARSLEVVAEHETLVAPERLAAAQPAALAVCGFSKLAWAGAPSLREALVAVGPLLEGAIIAGHNVCFDGAFLEASFARVGLAPPRVDHHRLDTASLAWPLLATGELPALSLDALVALFSLERSWPHRAGQDARLALEVARRILGRTRLGGRFSSLAGDEQELCEELLARLERGRGVYGPWQVEDGRDYPNETFEEVLDALHYVAAELVKRRRQLRARRRRVYVCTPFVDDPERHAARLLGISRRLIARGLLPVAPPLYLPPLVEHLKDPEQAKQLSLELVEACDELRVFGGLVTADMERELEHAQRRHIPVSFESEAVA